MQWLARICVKRPVFAAVLMLLIVVVGLAGYSQLGLDQFPNIDAPMVTITTTLEGAAPEEVESDITEKIEEAVSTIAGLDTLTSTSSEGISVVTVEFSLDKNGEVATQEVRDQVNRILSDLPQGIRNPQVQKMDPASSPIVYIALRTTQPLIEATEFADKKIRRQLEGIAGVGGNESIQYVARCRAHRGWVACASGRRSDQHNHRQWPDLLTASHAAGGAGCLLDTR